MYHFEWQIFVLAVVTEILGTASGLGSSILFLPLAQYFESPSTVLVLTGILHVFANSFRVILFWKKNSIKPYLRFVVFFTLCTAVGALFSKETKHETYRVALGLTLIGFVALRVAFSLQFKKFFDVYRESLMGVAGFLTGWLGTGGSIRAMALTTLELSKADFVLVSSSIDLGGDSLRTLIYLWNGYLEREHLLYIPVLALGAWLGSRIGKQALNHISQKVFERFILSTLAVMGFWILVAG